MYNQADLPCNGDCILKVTSFHMKVWQVEMCERQTPGVCNIQA